ncbi:acyl-CoA carboxylase subunit epsilon [Streptomyces sp. NPDC059247]|uniref:acyl-CoA carboxylase subunit epsilon n=1 Tax=Streptomyces sp. NPDC059247 TaxID=3346790 RepID=UPI00368A6B3C
MSTPANLLRVEKGQADPEELAAITAVLLARAAARTDETPAEGHRDRTAAGWRRLEREHGFRAPHSWR